MKIKVLLALVFFLFANYNFAQEITWTDVTSDYTLPEGVILKKGTRTSPALQMWVLDVDMNNENLAVRPYIAENATVPSHCSNNEAFAAINAGFFGGSSSYSAVIYPNELKANNISALTRNSQTYPVIRSMFSLNTDLEASVDWIYHFGNTVNDVYSYSAPLAYANNDPNPKPTPLKADGTQMENLLIGVGGAPVLIKGGTKNVTYNEEIMWGSGVGLTNNDPRTAVGYTADNHIIMAVADGRQTISEGVSLSELADIMLAFNCVEAMNLDGGGSSGMAIGNQYISSPSEQRAVPSILAITSRDKLNLPETPTFEEIIDTEDSKATKVGSWFETANAGFYGETKSLLSEKGTGDDKYEYNFTPPANEYCEVYAWWVSSSNRAQNTPYIIKHKYGETTVEMNQTQNGMQWAYVGKYVFKGDGTDKITISDAATLGTYVVADAVRVISYGEIDTETSISLSKTNSLKVNCFPNPFTNQTNIEFFPAKAENVNLSIYDNKGRLVQTLCDKFLPKGKHLFTFNAEDLCKGIYFYKLLTTSGIATGKLVLK